MKFSPILDKFLTDISQKEFEVDPQERLRNLINKINDNVSKCGAELADNNGNTTELLSEDQIERLKVKLPEFYKATKLEYEAFAKQKETVKKLEFEFI